MKCLLLPVLALLTLVKAGKDCPRPVLENGQVTGTSTGEMFVGKFECNPGFHLVGNSVVKCRQGKWTNRIPVCVKIGTCPPLASIPNGAAILVKGSRGSMYRIKCQAGFLRLGARRLHCSGRQWSAEMPVCAKPTCDVSGMDNIYGGYAAKIMDGAMYRYKCTEGAEMVGSPVLYCDGSTWNGTAPTCSGAPGPVKVQTWVDGQETSHVKLGDFVTVTCSSNGGFPAPKITIFKNFELVADSDAMRKPYFTFAASAKDNNADIACFANNKPENKPTEDHTSLTVSFPPKKVMVGGLTQLKRQNSYNFICRSEAASPPPTLVWSAINFRGETKEVVIVSEDSIDVGEGWEAVSSIQLQTDRDERDISITCRAGNTEGRVSHTINIRTEYMSETVAITGPSTMSHNKESRFTCSSSVSHPTPNLLWKLIKIKGEQEMEEELVEGDYVQEGKEEGGVSIKSLLKMTNVGRDVDRIVVNCLARVNGMEDVQSESHHVEITGAPGHPEMTGIQSGSSVPEGSHHLLTCSAVAGKPTYIHTSVVWFKDGVVVQGVDWHLKDGKVISQWSYQAEMGDEEIGCMVINEVVKEPLSTSIFVDVVKSETKPVEEHTQELEVVKHVEAAALEPEMDVEEAENIDTNEEENIQNELTNQQKDDNMEPEPMKEPTQELEVVKHVEAAVVEPEINVDEDENIDTNEEENIQNELTNMIESEYHQQKDVKLENEDKKITKDKNTNNENIEETTSLEEEKHFENTKQEILNDIEVTEKTIDYKEMEEAEEKKTTKIIRWIEVPIAVTEGYYKLYDDDYKNNDEEDDNYNEAMRPQQEVPAEVANQKTSKSLNAEIQPQSLIQSANSSPVFNFSLLLMLFSSILAFCFGNLTYRSSL